MSHRQPPSVLCLATCCNVLMPHGSTSISIPTVFDTFLLDSIFAHLPPLQAVRSWLTPFCLLQDKDAALRWVEEEVERVKGLFQQKEQRLTVNAADAQAAAAAATAEADTARARSKELEARLAAALAANEVRTMQASDCCAGLQAGALTGAIAVRQLITARRKLRGRRRGYRVGYRLP